MEAVEGRKEAKRTPEEMPWCGALGNTLRDTGCRKGSSADLELQATASYSTIHIKRHPKIITLIWKDIFFKFLITFSLIFQLI